MLNWASRFNICLFLDNHGYSAQPHVFECLLAVGARDELKIPAEMRQAETAAAGIASRDLFGELENFASKYIDDWLFGHFGYGSGSASAARLPDRIGFPDLFFFVPDIVIELKEDFLRIGLCPVGRVESDGPSMPHDLETRASAIFKQIFDADPRPSGTVVTVQSPVQSGFTREEYMDTVERLRAHILRGDCYEINFCQEFFTPGAKLDPVTVYLALSKASPTPFGAFYRQDEHYLFCASPERYLTRRGKRLLSQPIKGTSPRDLQNPDKDRASKESLYHSEKDRSENVMVVDLVRNDLSRVCLPGSVRVDELYGIYSFPQVHQMISTISGETAPGVHFSDCIRETFPMGSMTGAPKKRVMELIAQYERSRRGLFSGAVGYVLPGAIAAENVQDDTVEDRRDFDFNVVIRSIFYNSTTRHLSWQVGSGITFNSDSAKEYEECMLKAEGIRLALGL